MPFQTGEEWAGNRDGGRIKQQRKLKAFNILKEMYWDEYQRDTDATHYPAMVAIASATAQLRYVQKNTSDRSIAQDSRPHIDSIKTNCQSIGLDYQKYLREAKKEELLMH